MAFVKFLASARKSPLGAHASFRAYKNEKGEVTQAKLRIGRSGIEIMEKLGLDYVAGMRADLFFDSANGAVAIKVNENGQLKVRRPNMNKPKDRIEFGAADLTKMNIAEGGYVIHEPRVNEKEFDFLLFPIPTE
ncbi:hypothetical protein [Oceanisphaera sp. IT1-181]|uniref:hypothetical protein n=1 Tax=Oceanisphaera sp. IT1-181 TaxID=3081199 RepID=UPI0029C9BC15|nr:hypothetical protein [Oceanisphaera sp. IT1-181]